MSTSARPEWTTYSNVRVASAREVKRRPRPPGSSWLLDPDLDLATLRYHELKQRRRLISLSKRPPETPILSRKAFTNEQRRAVCLTALAHENISHKELATRFGTNQYTIARTLKDMKKWLNYVPSSDAKITRKRNPVHLIVQVDLRMWAEKCRKNNIFITDAMIKAQAMQSAKEHYLLDQPRPFACSPKWIRNFKLRSGIVNGRVVHPEDQQTPALEQERLSGPRMLGSPIALGASPSASSSRASYGSPSLTSLGLPNTWPYADVDTEPTTTESSTPAPVDSEMNRTHSAGQDVSLPIVDQTSPSMPYQAPLLQSSPELPAPNAHCALEFAAAVDQSQMYSGSHETWEGKLLFESAPLPNTDTSLLYSDDFIMNGFQALLDTQTSSLPPTAGSTDLPTTSASLDSGAVSAPVAGIAADAVSFFDLFPGHPTLASSSWSMPAPSALAQPAALSEPYMHLTESPSSLVPHFDIPPEDIDRLAAEMMSWPIEDVLGDIGVSLSQGQVVFPWDQLSLETTVTPHWPYIPPDGFGNTDLPFAST